MPADSPYRLFSDGALKREIDRFAAALDRTAPDQREPIYRDVAALRDELVARLRRRGQDEDGLGGVREDRTPSPGGGPAAAQLTRDEL